MQSDHHDYSPDAADMGDAGSVYAKLKNLLLGHEIRPNEHLSTRVVGDLFGASTTRVREALIRLAVEGLIVHFPNGGFYSRPLVCEELKDAYRVALILFKNCIETDLSRFDITDLRKPMELQFDKSGLVLNVTSEFTRSHVMFLEGLYREIALLSDNGCILRIIKTFNLTTSYVRELDLTEPVRVREIADDMMALIGFLQARRADEAIANLRLQFDKKLQRLPELVKEGNSRDLHARPLSRM